LEFVGRAPNGGEAVAPVTDFKEWLADYENLKPKFLASIKDGETVAPDNA